MPLSYSSVSYAVTLQAVTGYNMTVRNDMARVADREYRCCLVVANFVEVKLYSTK